MDVSSSGRYLPESIDALLGFSFPQRNSYPALCPSIQAGSTETNSGGARFPQSDQLSATDDDFSNGAIRKLVDEPSILEYTGLGGRTFGRS